VLAKRDPAEALGLGGLLDRVEASDALERFLGEFGVGG
jgi:hypothetical protein